jgi:hypothetical protein
MEHVSCEHGNSAPIKMLDEIGESQAKSGQIKCVICAYQRGYKWGVQKKFLLTGEVWDFPICKHGARAHSKTLSELPVDQAGMVPHKCPTCAYNRGFEDGRAFSNPTA